MTLPLPPDMFGINLDDIPRNGLWICARCGVPITPFNYSGWEAFVDGGNATQPICILCEHMGEAGGKKSDTGSKEILQ